LLRDKERLSPLSSRSIEYANSQGFSDPVFLSQVRVELSSGKHIYIFGGSAIVGGMISALLAEIGQVQIQT
jgi:hypothetical protein